MGMAEKDLNKGTFAPPALGSGEFLAYPELEDEHADEENEEPLDDEPELDLSAGEDDKASDPVRLYLRQMGRVPLLTREQEVVLAKRIEAGQIKSNRAIARSPISVRELTHIGQELETGALGIRDVVSFGDQVELIELDDRAEEYLRCTVEAETHQSAVEIKRSHLAIARGVAQTVEAKSRMTEANLRLVVSIAKKY